MRLPIQLFTLIVFLSGLSLKAQPHALLQDFTGYQNSNQITLRWTFRSGSLCEGTRIERSADGLVFEEVGQIPGVCGSSETAVTFTFTDSLPQANAVNYYRLELGNYGYTSTVSVEFLNTGDNGFIVLSSSSGQTDILFQNSQGRTGKALIFSSNGKKLAEMAFTGKRLSLPEARFSSGIYLLLLAFSDNFSISGNFIIP